MTADAAALLITVLILIAIALWVPFVRWCAGCMHDRKQRKRSTTSDGRASLSLVEDGGRAGAEGRRW